LGGWQKLALLVHTAPAWREKDKRSVETTDGRQNILRNA